MKVEATVLKFGCPNRNGRVFSDEAIRDALNNYRASGSNNGELEHIGNTIVGKMKVDSPVILGEYDISDAVRIAREFLYPQNND